MPHERFQVKDFDLTQPFIVLKEMNMNGRKYQPGDLFPHHKFKVQPRRLAQLFDRRFIGHVPDGQPIPVEKTEEELPPVTPVQDTPPPADNAETKTDQPPVDTSPVVDPAIQETATVNTESASNADTEKALDVLFNNDNEGDPADVI